MLLHDSAGEFRSEELARYLQGYDIRSSTIPADSTSSSSSRSMGVVGALGGTLAFAFGPQVESEVPS